MIQLFESIRRKISAQINHSVDDERNGFCEASTKTAAVSCRGEAKALHPGRRRLKENYTSHWDLDYLPRQEVERLTEEAKVEDGMASD